MRPQHWISGIVLSVGLFLTTPIAFAGPKEDVGAATTKWVEAFSENSVEKIVALYAKDGVLWGTASPTVRADPAAIRAYFEGSFKAVPGVKASLGDQLIRIYDNTAVNTGYYSFSFVKDGETKTIPARFSFTYVKDGQNWAIVDHHSSAMPSPPK
jgi:uncharacterized protein (TIGR02246 family)